jgi:serine/threonine-protein kinase RsbW
LPQVKYAYPLPNHPESVGRARAWVRIMLTTYGHEDALDAALLVISELTTNAVQHAPGPEMIKIVCEADAGILTMGVIDYGKRHPIMLDAGQDDEYGRGLALVDAIADDWGCQPYEDGKLVYARMKLAQACMVREVAEPCVIA